MPVRAPEAITSIISMSPPEISGLSSRDRHLFGPGPKRMLSLDGGGVRGAVAIGFLERLEKLIEDIEERPTLLCDWFDFIGGTSTGGHHRGRSRPRLSGRRRAEVLSSARSSGISPLVLADGRTD